MSNDTVVPNKSLAETIFLYTWRMVRWSLLFPSGLFLFAVVTFAYGSRTVYFPFWSVVHYEVLPGVDSRIEELLDNASAFGSEYGSRAQGNAVRLHYASVFDYSTGQLFYRFRNEGSVQFWLDSHTIRWITGKVWKINAGEALYLSVPCELCVAVTHGNRSASSYGENAPVAMLVKTRVIGNYALHLPTLGGDIYLVAPWRSKAR